MQVSFYKNALSNEGVTTDAVAILNGIKDGKWDKAVSYLRGLSKEKYDLEKKFLPAATFSGTFEPTRLDANMKSYTGIITIDLDKIGSSLHETKDKLRKHPHVFASFISPSNDGLKILILTDTTADKHGMAFDYLKKDIHKHLGIELDKSGRNPSRLCFVSHDPELHLNLEATPMPISEHIKDIPAEPVITPINSNDRRIIVAERITRAKHNFTEGHRNEYVHYLCCCMNRLGVSKNEAHEYVVNTYHELPLSELRPTILSGYRHTSEFNKWTIEDIEKAPAVVYDEKIRRGFIGENLFDILMLMVGNDFSGTGPRTFIGPVDDALGGCMERGNVYGMIGRDGTYKSIMAMYFAIENAKEGKASIYFNMEMSRGQMAHRIITKETGVNVIKEKREGRLTKEAAESVANNLRSITDNMIIVSESNIAYTGLADSIRAEIAKRGNLDVQFIIIDGISSMADEKNQGEVFAAIDNSMNLKELAKALNVAILVLAHTRSDAAKHIRNTGPYVRGGIKITGNMDGYFCHSLLIDPITNDSMGEDIIYRPGMFYMKFIDKRGAASEINKIINIGENIKVDVTDLNPGDFEIKLKR